MRWTSLCHISYLAVECVRHKRQSLRPFRLTEQLSHGCTMYKAFIGCANPLVCQEVDAPLTLEHEFSGVDGPCDVQSSSSRWSHAVWVVGFTILITVYTEYNRGYPTVCVSESECHNT